VEDLQRVLKETGTTAILATHDRLEALRLSDRMAVMKGGRIFQQGPPDDVMNRPVDEFVASFVGVETILNGWVIKRNGDLFWPTFSGHEVEAVGDVHVGEEVALCIRRKRDPFHPPFKGDDKRAEHVSRQDHCG